MFPNRFKSGVDKPYCTVSKAPSVLFSILPLIYNIYRDRVRLDYSNLGKRPGQFSFVSIFLVVLAFPSHTWAGFLQLGALLSSHTSFHSLHGKNIHSSGLPTDLVVDSQFPFVISVLFFIVELGFLDRSYHQASYLFLISINSCFRFYSYSVQHSEGSMGKL